MKTLIRPATLEDANQLFVLIQHFPTPILPGREAYMAALRAKVTDPASYVGLAVQANRSVGYISGCRHATFYAGGETAWVDEILVLEELRGKGIGRELMERFELWATQQGCKLVGLATAGARAFYERLGYESKAGYYKKYLGGA